MTKTHTPAFKMGGLYSRDKQGVDTLIERTKEPDLITQSPAKNNPPKNTPKPVKEKA